MRVFRTAIPREDGSLRICDTIQHDGTLWLAPDWLEDASKPYSKPARLIGMSGLKYRSMPLQGEVDFVVEDNIPAAVLEGRARGEQAAPFVILERPDVRIQKSARGAAVVARNAVDDPPTLRYESGRPALFAQSPTTTESVREVFAPVLTSVPSANSPDTGHKRR